ncbi:MAG TPA: tRNA pseudouridine(13) synthase TruD [Polyangiaceae bacterium]|nr:tRNA pseudouridine(13) synthase TruD [Polyangiaceae bacterium]
MKAGSPTPTEGKPRATIRATPEDFLVEELPAYEPSGAGEHLYVRFRKRGLTTLQAAAELARRLGVPAREAGTAGLKDRHAVTVQTASFPWPLARPLPEAAALGAEGLEVLSLARHGNKLRTGHLRGNRFVIVLRDLDEGARPGLALAFLRLGDEGVPNWYGPQRFGREGDNAEQARAWLAGRAPAPRNPRVRRLQFSALQSELFHRVLERRVAEGTFREPLEGDLVQREGGGPLRSFPIVDREGFEGPGRPGGEGATAAPPGREARAPGREPGLGGAGAPDDGGASGGADAGFDEGPYRPTGPMYGVRMRWPAGAPGALEREILAEALGDGALLERWSSLGEGSRRALALTPRRLRATAPADSPGSLRVEFVLPKGAYATTVLGALCQLRDAAAPGGRGGGDGGGGAAAEGPDGALEEELA